MRDTDVCGPPEDEPTWEEIIEALEPDFGVYLADLNWSLRVDCSEGVIEAEILIELESGQRVLVSVETP
jgi:hypothetical protein